MDFNSVIEKRHSSRSFKPKKADWRSILEAIDSALKAPFADNRCNLKFIIIENPSSIKKMAELSNQLWISESLSLIIVCSDDTNLENMHKERGRIYSRQQAGAAIENLLLKLTDLGLSSCWIGAYSDEMIKQTLNIPQHIQIEALIPVGYEKKKEAKKRKSSLENHLYWEEWGNKHKGPIFKEEIHEFGIA